MSEQDILTDETLPDDGGSSGGGLEDEMSLSLEELNAKLGKSFTSKEAALKSIKDTFSFVGRKQETKAPQIDTSNFVKRDELESIKEENFFSKNPDYEPYKDLIKGLKKEGQSFNDVVNQDAFKGIYEKAKTSDEMAKAKSVLQSNPRISMATDKMSEAKTAAQEGRISEAGDKALGAVLDVYGLKDR
jgi:hypothetical protein